jgi:NTP pyrophosphatase (non-canonical NTP hydrolase)
MYKLSDQTKKSLSSLQEEINNNYQKTDIDKALNWMSEEMIELQEGINKNDTENIKEELAQMFIWSISISNILGFKLEDIIEKEIDHHLNKYPL